MSVVTAQTRTFKLHLYRSLMRHIRNLDGLEQR
jgi:hypothetical protein